MDTHAPLITSRPLRPPDYAPTLVMANQKLETANQTSDAEPVAFLFDLYQRITSLLPAAKPNKANQRAKAAA